MKPIAEALDWLGASCEVLRAQYIKLRRSAKQGIRKARKSLAGCEHKGRKLRSILDAR